MDDIAAFFHHFHRRPALAAPGMRFARDTEGYRRHVAFRDIGDSSICAVTFDSSDDTFDPRFRGFRFLRGLVIGI